METRLPHIMLWQMRKGSHFPNYFLSEVAESTPYRQKERTREGKSGISAQCPNNKF
jgi:hypothetical protein